MMRLRHVLYSVLFLLSVSLTAHAQHAGGDSQVQLIPVSPEMESAAEKALKDYTPQEGKVIGEINKNGVYTLSGDLFHNGNLYSAVDNDNYVIMCQWQKPAWKVLFGINIPTVWNFPVGYLHQQTLPSPDNQPEPFWMLNLQNRPLFIIAADVEKAGQYYYVILLDQAVQQILSTASSFALRPVVKHNYLLTGDASRGKSEWEATYFSQIQKNSFIVTKSWEGSQPWHAEDRENQPDDSSNYASSDGKGYVILPDNSDSKNPATYLIVRCDPGQKRPDLYPPPGKPFAAIYNTPKNANTVGDPTILYLFGKLTGLPKEMFPGYDAALDKKIAAVPSSMFVVSGTDKDIINLITP